MSDQSWSTARAPDDTDVSMAIRHGYATLLLFGLAAAVFDAYRPDLLHLTLPMVLVAGLLVPLLSLGLGRPAEPADPSG